MISQGATEVKITIPASAEFVSVARLAILGIASRMQFSYDEIEDIRLAVGEACTSTIGWMKRHSDGNMSIDINCSIDEGRLLIEVTNSEPLPNIKSTQEPSEKESNEQSLGALLMGLLVDEANSEETSEGKYKVTLVKYQER